MKSWIPATLFACLFASTLPSAFGQSPASATKELTLSAWGAATGTYTGLGGGKNVGATAGVDIGIPHFTSFVPSVEFRGTWPFYRGNTDSLEEALGGVRVSRFYGQLHPYVDFLYGRTEIHYEDGGYINPAGTFLYTSSPSNVLSAGGGVDIEWSRSLALKADLQWQHYDSPVVVSGHLNAVPLSIGVVYTFHFHSRPNPNPNASQP